MRTTLLMAMMLFSLWGWSRTLVVGNGQKYTSVKQAIHDANDNDTILIKKGTYYIDDAKVTKPLTIIGEDFPLLSGADKYEIFTLSGQHIKVAGIHFTNSGYSSMNDYAAIKIVDATNVTVENCKVTNSFFGIHIANSTYITIRNNNLSGLTKNEQTTGNGIHLWKCSNALIENNQVQGHRDGIYFEFVSDSYIRGNRSTQNIRYGLHFMFSNDDHYEGNTFNNNGAGVAVMYSKHVTMHKNLFENNWGAASYGLLLKEISDSKIINNRFIQNTIGVYMEGASRNNVTDNAFIKNGWAGKVQANCNDNVFTKNNFIGNTFDIGTNGSLVLNNFNNNYWDKYEGYDLNKDGYGDVPYHPVSLYSTIVEDNPNSLMLLRSFIVTLLDKAEKAIPSITPENLRDDKPFMKALKL